jgi:hypothetical protein
VLQVLQMPNLKLTCDNVINIVGGGSKETVALWSGGTARSLPRAA